MAAATGGTTGGGITLSDVYDPVAFLASPRHGYAIYALKVVLIHPGLFCRPRVFGFKHLGSNISRH